MCYNLSYELRVYLDEGLREDKGYIEVVKCKDMG